MVETLLRADGADATGLLLSVILALASTVPIALIAVHWTVFVALAAAGFGSLIADQRLAAAGVVAVVFGFYHTARHRSGLIAGLLVLPYALLAFGTVMTGDGPATSDVSIETSTSETERQRPTEDESPEPDRDGYVYPLLMATLTAGATAVGYVQRTRHTEAQLEARAAAFADDLETHTARGERARIARELHDVVAHRISAIAVQAETARLTTPDLRPESAQQLAAIGDSARDALAEMRRLVGVLRKDTQDTGDPADRRPQPGIEQIGELVDDSRRVSGTTTRLIMSGNVRGLDPGAELTIYRVVQEALTNARRHSPGAAVDVELDYGVESLELRIRDAGGAGVSSPIMSGHGLRGMRERVEMLGGEFKAGPSSTGGFTVAARLPMSTIQSTPSGANHG